MHTSLEEEKGKNYRTVIPAHSLCFFVEDRGLEPWFLEIPSSLWGHNPHHCTFFGKPIGVIHLLIRISVECLVRSRHWHYTMNLKIDAAPALIQWTG